MQKKKRTKDTGMGIKLSNVEWAYGEKKITPKVIHIRRGNKILCGYDNEGISWHNTKMSNEFADTLPTCPECLEART